MTDVRPNLLLFITDDHAAWASRPYGNHELVTPAFDRLSGEGCRFENAFTPCPVCSPARACFFTGQTPSQVGIHDWLQEVEPNIGDRDWLAGTPTFPALLRAAGYHTLHVGKWHLGRSHLRPPGFDRWFGFSRGQGLPHDTHDYNLDGVTTPRTGGKARLLTDQAIAFLDQRPDNQPFCLTVGHIDTHSPYESRYHDPDLVDLYRNATFNDLPQPPHHPWRKNEGLPDGAEHDPDAVRDRRLGYYAAVTEIDRQVGRLLDHLDAIGQLDHTLVAYTSDHGCCLGHHGFWGKGNSTRPLNMHETSLRVPLLVRGPGVAPDTVVTRCVDHYATFATVLDLAGVDTPGDDYPGRSYRPLLRGDRSTNWDDTRYGEYGDLRMIRTTEFKYVHRHPRGPFDLYDLRRDPDESDNVAGREAYWPDQQRLTQQLADWYARHESTDRSGLHVKQLAKHNTAYEPWRDGLRERRGLQND